MKRTMTNRFYVASNRMSDGMAQRMGWLKPNTLECINDARSRLMKDDTLDEVYIVEVVAIVKRASAPIVVEEVRRDK